MKVLLTWHPSDDEFEYVRRRLPSEVDVVTAPAGHGRSRFYPEISRVIELAQDAEVFFGWVIPREAITEAEKLKFIAYCRSGMDNVPLDLLRAKGVQVANAAGVYAVPVAEHALALLLASAKRLIINHQAAVEVRWLPKREPPYASVELAGKTVAILGLGKIGEHVARLANAFGMRVLGINRSGNNSACVDEVHDATALHDVLRRAHFTVLCLPLTAETRNIIDEEAIRSMRPDAHLINVARGDLVDEAALHTALVENRIAGFATDVWWEYSDTFPSGQHFGLPSRFGIHRLPNVIATPDRAANTIEGINRYIEYGTDSVAAFVRGEPQPRRLVDLVTGY